MWTRLNLKGGSRREEQGSKEEKLTCKSSKEQINSLDRLHVIINLKYSVWNSNFFNVKIKQISFHGLIMIVIIWQGYMSNRFFKLIFLTVAVFTITPMRITVETSS